MELGKRRYKRFIVENLDIHARTLFATEVELIDISLGGACIKVQKNLQPGGRYVIKLESESMSISLQCTVIWIKLSGNKKTPTGELIPVYTTGLQFRDIYSDKLVALMDFIGESGVPNDQRLSGLRFKIHTNETAIIDYEETFIVKKISLGGMLVETSYDLPIDEKYPMELHIPGEDLPIRFRGRIASSIKLTEQQPTRFDIGIEFLDTSEHDKSRLDGFINSLHDI